MNPQKVSENLRLFDVFYARRTFVMGPEWPRRSKTKKTICFSLLFMQKSRTLDGFTYFLVPPSTTSPGSLGPRMALNKPSTLAVTHFSYKRRVAHDALG